MTDVDAVLLVGFGGPEGPDDVMPFLRNVTRGRDVPEGRLQEVAGHYLEVFGGVSPINQQCRELQAAVQQALPELPVYWGNRNWDPFLGEAMKQMASEGRRHALAVVTSAFPSYPGCRQYQEDIARALVPDGPQVSKLRHFYNEPGFLDTMRRNVAAEGLSDARLVFTAHSIPVSLAKTSGPSGDAYVTTLETAAAQIAGERRWDLVFQSRSGPAHVPWLEPDISDHLRTIDDTEVVVVPLGFVSDHVEVVFDLDIQAAGVAKEQGVTMRRARTVGTDPEFVQMLAGLVRERIAGPELEDHGGLATHDRCPAQCCPSPPARSPRG